MNNNIKWSRKKIDCGLIISLIIKFEFKCPPLIIYTKKYFPMLSKPTSSPIPTPKIRKEKNASVTSPGKSNVPIRSDKPLTKIPLDTNRKSICKAAPQSFLKRTPPVKIST